MKALLSKLFISLTLVVTLLHPAVAYAQAPAATKVKATPTQTSIYDKTTPTPVATSSGSVQLIPVGDGTYKIAPQDPRLQGTHIQQAGCGPFSIVCDAVGDVLSNLKDCALSPFSFDIKGFLYDCSGASSLLDIGGDVAKWGFKEIFTVAGAIIKAGVGIIQNVLIAQLGGCETQDNDCWKDQYQSYLDPNKPLTHGGALQVAAVFAGQTASMQLPVGTDIFLAHLNPFQEANADGYADLRKADVVFKIWQNVRNAAYALSIVILVIVGFMIMLRSRLDPKTAVSVTNSLPKIVLMLILITFSFAISGLIIDLGRVLLQLSLSILPNVGVGTLSRIFLNAILGIFLPVVLVILGIAAIPGVNVAVIPIILAASLIIIIFFLILLLYICFKLLAQMITRYAKFLVTTMFAPLLILLLPLPGGSKYITDFYRRQFAYILTIPIIVTLVEISFLIAGSCIPSPFSGGVFGGPQNLVGGIANPCGNALGGGFSFNPLGFVSLLAPFLGLGILWMATQASQIADDIVGVKPIGGHGGGHGGGILGIITGPPATLSKMGKSMEGIGKFGKVVTPYIPAPVTSGVGTGLGRVGRLFGGSGRPVNMGHGPTNLGHAAPIAFPTHTLPTRGGAPATPITTPTHLLNSTYGERIIRNVRDTISINRAERDPYTQSNGTSFDAKYAQGLNQTQQDLIRDAYDQQARTQGYKVDSFTYSQDGNVGGVLKKI